jgi:hypothetical protein
MTPSLTGCGEVRILQLATRRAPPASNSRLNLTEAALSYAKLSGLKSKHHINSCTPQGWMDAEYLRAASSLKMPRNSHDLGLDRRPAAPEHGAPSSAISEASIANLEAQRRNDSTRSIRNSKGNIAVRCGGQHKGCAVDLASNTPVLQPATLAVEPTSEISGVIGARPWWASRRKAVSKFSR